MLDANEYAKFQLPTKHSECWRHELVYLLTVIAVIGPSPSCISVRLCALNGSSAFDEAAALLARKSYWLMATEDASSPFDSRSRQPPRRRSAGGSESGASRRRRAAMAAASAGVDSLCSGQSVDLSRKALLGWMNSLLQLDLHELVECRDGDVFCQLLDIVFPQSVQLERVRWEPKTQQHRLHNMRLLQQALTRLNIKRVRRRRICC